MATEYEVERQLPISTVADMLGTGRDYVYNRIKAGELPVVELGNQKPKQRIPESAVLAFIKARTFGGAA